MPRVMAPRDSRVRSVHRSRGSAVRLEKLGQYGHVGALCAEILHVREAGVGACIVAKVIASDSE